MDVKVPMDAVGSGKWANGDRVWTSDLLACFVVAASDEHRFVFAHAPPAREKNEELQMASAEIIGDYKDRLTKKYHETPMAQPVGYLLISTMMHEDSRNLLRDWFKCLNITFTEPQYNPLQARWNEDQGRVFHLAEGQCLAPTAHIDGVA